MSLMASAMKTECLSATRRLGVLLVVAFSGGTRRWCNVPISSDTLGHYYSDVNTFGSLPWGVPADRDFSLSPIEVTPTVADTDKDLSNYLESSSAETLTTSPPVATMTLFSPNVAVASWFTLFTGVLVKLKVPAPGQVQLFLRTNTTTLDATFGRLLAPGDWPYADPSARSQIAPMIYGTHDSGGDGGAVPAILVDIPSKRYLLSVGYLKSVDRVYIDGVQTTSFTVSHPTVNARIYTCVDFTTMPTGDVTADVTGYEATGDGSGALMETPSDQLKHLLSNFVFGSYTSGSWLATSALIDATAFSTASTFLTTRGHKGSRRISDPEVKGIDVVNEWCESFRCRPYWSNLGLLGVKFEDIDVATLYLDDPWLKQGVTCDNDLEFDDDTLELISRVEVQYQYAEARGMYTASLMVQESGLSGATLGFGAPDTISLPWSYAGQ